MDPRQFNDPREAQEVEMGQKEWLTDAFRFRALKLAIGSLLGALEPKGEIKSPLPGELIDKAVANSPAVYDNPALIDLMKHTYKSPENLAAYVFSNLWIQLNRTRPLSDDEREEIHSGGWVGMALFDEFYGLAEARRDLNLHLSEGSK
jgi:hypothetical protein